MSAILGPIDMRCDAPEYSVVQACSQIGMVAPEDVCWRRIRNFLTDKARGGNALYDLWRLLWGWGIPVQKACVCGRGFPDLHRVMFTFHTGEIETFLLAQCHHCRNVFWETEEGMSAAPRS